jgi:hypothetical protein
MIHSSSTCRDTYYRAVLVRTYIGLMSLCPYSLLLLTACPNPVYMTPISVLTEELSILERELYTVPLLEACDHHITCFNN